MEGGSAAIRARACYTVPLKHPEIFRLVNVRHCQDLSRLRGTLDYDEDLRFAREVYHRLYHGQVFKMQEILQLLEEEPQWSLSIQDLCAMQATISHCKKEHLDVP